MRSLVSLLIVAALYAGKAQQPAAPQTFRSGRDVLTISAAVRDADGKPLIDLRASDFAVRIDGQPRAVLTVRSYGSNAPATAAPLATVPVAHFTRVTDSAPGRAVVIAIDRPSIRSGSEKPAIETAATLIGQLSPADAVGAIGLPAVGVELTRDHAAVAAAMRGMTGTQPRSDWRHYLSWEEAFGYERGDRTVIATALERECVKQTRSETEPPDRCPQDLALQASQMLPVGRAQALATLTALTAVLERLATVRAPKHLVLISGGLIFDPGLLTRYRALADQAARSRVALSIVHLDQPASDVTDRVEGTNVFGGRDYATGLGNLASMTGGDFYMGVGRASGVFARIASDITHFYELGVEARPSDDDGKIHRVEVKVSRPDARVHAPAAIGSEPGATATIKAALAQPTSVSDLPLEVATYMTHSRDPGKVRMIVAARLSDGTVPNDWGYVVTADGKILSGGDVHVDSTASVPWTASASIDLPPGAYRLRAAVITLAGRMGTLEIPIRVGLRAAGTAVTSDLIVGTVESGRLLPRAKVAQDEGAVGMIELSSSESLAGSSGTLELTAVSGSQPAWRGPLTLRTRADDKSVVVAETTLDLRSLPPGLYTASAILAPRGTPSGRVSRLLEIMPGAHPTAPPPTAATSAPVSPRAKAPQSQDPAVAEVITRLGRYVADFGAQASLIIGVERYQQRNRTAVLGEPSERELVSEFALVKTNDATGWVGYRDVMSVNGKPVRDRQDRLMALLRAGTPDMAEARRIADESARFNIGPTHRNFNEPTVAMFFFVPAHLGRFSFTKKGADTIQGVAVWQIDFKEVRHPTFIRTSDGNDVVAQGSLWVNPEDGTIVKTALFLSGFSGPGTTSSVDVTFARDPRLGLWLPATMSERYEGVMRGQSAAERDIARPVLLTGIATYSDFKRFETSATFTIK